MTIAIQPANPALFRGRRDGVIFCRFFPRTACIYPFIPIQLLSIIFTTNSGGKSSAWPAIDWSCRCASISPAPCTLPISAAKHTLETVQVTTSRFGHVATATESADLAVVTITVTTSSGINKKSIFITGPQNIRPAYGK